MSQAHTSELESREHTSGSTKQNPKDSSQNDPGLPEALEALESLTLSSGSQARMAGMASQDSDSLAYPAFALFVDVFSTSLSGQGAVGSYVY